MFSKIFKKNQPAAETPPELPQESVFDVTWEDRLQAAIGNDMELLALAIDAPSIDHKLSAVQALVSEEGLRTAEREFRKHDRRVHGFAKQRYEALIKQRETRASAAELVLAAAALVEAPTIPANRLVELDQAWDLLDSALIEDECKLKFARLRAELTELMRERGERKRAIGCWSAAASQALADLNSACASVAATGTELQEVGPILAAAGVKTRAALAAMPAPTASTSKENAIDELGAAMQSALQELALIEAKLAILGELQVCQALPHAASSDERPNISTTAIERWQELPPVANQRVENALKARLDEHLHLREKARKQLQRQNSQTVDEKDKTAQQARLKTLLATADSAEAALAAGQLAEAGNKLATLQAAVGKGGTSPALQTRIGALQSEFSRLKDWQHWGGGRARDDLVVEAETLAASTVTEEGSRPLKLPIKQIENSIEKLRARWKELDRLGGATSKPLWQRFDGALKTAYLPVAAHLAQLSATRQENLAARNGLLTALDALDITVNELKAPDWKEIGRALSHFQTEWRKLGPLEHTVPHKSQTALLEHMKASVARLEEPLKEVQASAQAEREQLIVRARALSQNVQGRDMLVKLRELQSQWQSHAKSQPLPRKVENLLWAEFKAASDALMNQREAAFSARDAELRANQALREALIAQIEELHQDTSSADIKRILASVDTEWHKIGEAPRNQAARLDSKYRAAREQAHEYVVGSAQRAWQLTCDALLAKLALCEEQESTAPSASIEARWQNLPVLPIAWEQALQARYKSGDENPNSGSAANGGESLDKLLLQLESSLDIPSPTAFQTARQTLKLLAMKDAMEGRRPAASITSDIEKMIVAALGYAQLRPDQHSRFLSIIAAFRRSGSGGL